MSFSVPLTSFFNDVKICVTSYFMYGVSHEGKHCTFNEILLRKGQISIERYLFYLSVSQKSILCDVYMCMYVSAVYHTAQWYWSDKLWKLITDQWRASLGALDSESCWFTEEICTYMRCWESPGDLPLVIYLFVSFRSIHCALLAKRHKIYSTGGRSPGLSQERMQEPINIFPSLPFQDAPHIFVTCAHFPPLANFHFNSS